MNQIGIIKHNSLSVGDAILTTEGVKIDVTDGNVGDLGSAKLLEGDIVFHKNDGSITQAVNGNKDAVLVDGGNLTSESSDDKANYDGNKQGFWAKLFGKGNAAQDATLFIDRGSDEAYKTELSKAAQSANPIPQGGAVNADGSTDTQNDSTVESLPNSNPASPTRYKKEGTKIETALEASICLRNRLFQAGTDSNKTISKEELLAISKSSNDGRVQNSIKNLLSDPKKFNAAADKNGNVTLASLNNLIGYLKDKQATGNVSETSASTEIDPNSNQDLKALEITIEEHPIPGIANGQDAANILKEQLDPNRTYTKAELTDIWSKNQGTPLGNALVWVENNVVYPENASDFKLNTAQLDLTDFSTQIAPVTALQLKPEEYSIPGIENGQEAANILKEQLDPNQTYTKAELT
ncbi:MAG: hypothetical protein HQ446_03840, partial [Polaromonas sp.]|nr:hypothetical protein [Polaromonas sp.]